MCKMTLKTYAGDCCKHSTSHRTLLEVVFCCYVPVLSPVCACVCVCVCVRVGPIFCVCVCVRARVCV